MSHRQRSDNILLALISDRTAVRRFWSKVLVSGSNDCWEYSGPRVMGYGVLGFRHNNKRYTRRANRISLALETGIAPVSKQACHNCPGGDNKACVNPKHLFWATDAEHKKDTYLKGQMAHGDSCGTSVLTSGDITQIKHLRRGGASLKYLASLFGVTTSQISLVCLGKAWKREDASVVSIPSIRVGKLNPMSKLTAAKVRVILKEHKAGVSNIALAKRFGVRPPSIRAILTGRTWRAVSGL